MSNIEDFDQGVALILRDLLEAFPQETTIVIPELNTNADGTQLRNYSATADFLALEGFIRFANRTFDGSRFFNATLTMKGLAVLNSVPDLLTENSTSLGRRIVDALKSGSKEAVKAVVNQVITAGVTAGMSGLGR